MFYSEMPKSLADCYCPSVYVTKVWHVCLSAGFFYVHAYCWFSSNLNPLIMWFFAKADHSTFSFLRLFYVLQIGT